MNLTGQADSTDFFYYAREIKTLIYLAPDSPDGESNDILLPIQYFAFDFDAFAEVNQG